jgi:hypothetical protein
MKQTPKMKATKTKTKRDHLLTASKKQRSIRTVTTGIEGLIESAKEAMRSHNQGEYDNVLNLLNDIRDDADFYAAEVETVLIEK